MSKKEFLAFMTIALMFSLLIIPPAQTQTITPSQIEVTLHAGESTSFNITINTGAKPIPKIDVVFAIDRTGSMEDEISIVKAKAIEIMNNITSKVDDSWFGLVSFMDYNSSYSYPGYSAQYGSASSGDFPWQIDQQPTEDIAKVSSAINALWIGSGVDEPECYTRVLYESMSLNWRALSKKMLIVIGDAPTHDLNFGGRNFGGDPGRDAMAQTVDDLDFETVVSQVKDEGITVLAVQGSMYEPMRTYANATFEGMSVGYENATGTGGQHFLLANAGEIPEVISKMIEEEVSTINRLTLSVPTEHESWVSFTPKEYADVPPENTRVFNVTVTVPNGTVAGEVTFLIQALGDGALLGSTQVNIIIPSAATFDMGFRPNPDGYSFDNFGRTLTWDMFEQFFGRDTVRHSNGDKRYAAEIYFNRYYKNVGSGGCCLGFSSSSMINFKQANQTYAGSFALAYYTLLYNAAKENVTQSIAYYQGVQKGYEFITQVSNDRTKDPNYFYNKTKDYISNGNPVVIGMFSPSGIGGHAVAPYRIEESGHMGYVYIYDNNYHGDASKRIEFDLTANTWDYRPSLFTHYYGDQTHPRMTISPLSLYAHQGIAPWTAEEVVLGLDGAAQLLLTDGAGRTCGFKNGHYTEEIPKVVNISPLMQNEKFQPQTFFIPEDLIFNATIYGDDNGEVALSACGYGGWAVELIAEVNVDSVDSVEIGRGSLSITYLTNKDERNYNVSISKEMPSASRVFSIDTHTSKGDIPTLKITDMQNLEYTNIGKSKTYDLLIEQRGSNSMQAAFQDIQIEANSKHIIEVTNWDNEKAVQIVLKVDRNNDGTVDEVITLKGVGGSDAYTMLFTLTIVMATTLAVTIAIVMLRKKRIVKTAYVKQNAKPR